MLFFHVAETGKHLLRTQNVFLCVCVPDTNCCVRNKFCARRQTGKHFCRPFIREKIRRVLDKTRTARINGTKQAFASYFRRVLAKTRLK